MKITQHTTENGKLLVFVDPEDTVLPLPTEIQKKSKEEQKKYFNDTYLPLLRFNGDTYDTLKKRDTVAWDVVFGSVNKFLTTLTNEEKQAIGLAFISMHNVLQNMTSATLNQSIASLGDLLLKLDQFVDLSPKLEAFVEKDMPIPDLSDVGGRPQDTEKMTFRRPHVLKLTTIALWCKLLAPVFGQFFWQYKKNTNADNDIKEIHCATILTPLFEKRYKDLILKLNYFVGNILIQQFKQKDDIISAYSGNTIDSQALNGVSSIYTRKFITVDLYKKDGNLMTYITTCLKNSVDTQYRTASSKSSIRERETNLKETTSDEGNTSRLENESFTSKKTADIPLIVEWLIDFEVEHYKQREGMSDDVYEQAMAYYRNNLPPMTPISNYLLCTYFGTDIGGAIGISMISAMSYIKLAIILQFILIKQGFKGLANAIMITPLNRIKTPLTAIDNKVRMTWSNTYAYRNFKQKFPYGVGDRECDGELRKIVEFLTTRVCTYNTAPVFWDLMDEDNKNGQEYQCTEDIMESLCNFINDIVKRYNGEM